MTQEFEHYVDGWRVVVHLPLDYQIAPFDALAQQLNRGLLTHDFCEKCKLGKEYYCRCEVEL